MLSVYEDLEHLELQLSAIYQPQNSYCIHVDLKSPYVFHDAVRKLAACFPNVIIPTRLFPVNRVGRFMMKAFDACLQALQLRPWRYAILLQNHDFPLRTNAELVRILKLHRGGNDVGFLPDHPSRYRHGAQDSLDSLGFPIHSHTGSKTHSLVHPPANLSIYKDYVQATLSRDFVLHSLRDPAARQLLQWLDQTYRGAELYFPTLNHNRSPPGGYPQHCVSSKRHGRKSQITRISVWGSDKVRKCRGRWRHGICVFSLADFKFLFSQPHFFANKFSLDTFPLALHCIHELHFNRTHQPHQFTPHHFGYNHSFYLSLSTVRFQNWRIAHPNQPESSFPCVWFKGMLY